MLWQGMYLENQRGEKPEFLEALKLILFGNRFIPLYFLYFYFAYYDFSLTLHDQWRIGLLTAFLACALRVMDECHPISEITWDERVSGLRFKLTEKAQRKFNKRVEKNYKWFSTKIAFKLSKYKIAPITALLVFGFLAFNLVREGSTPENYDQYLYQRPATAWEDNAYFGLAGLDAPAAVQDFYTYGRAKAANDSSKYVAYKKRIGIPFTNDVPNIDHSLAQEEGAKPIHFINEGDDNWACIFNIEAIKSNQTCPAASDALKKIQDNQTLWTRFNTLPDYKNFSIPDQFIDPSYDVTDLLSLAKLKAVSIIDLQNNGQSDAAVSEWARYMKLYLSMVETSSSLVHKATFLVLVTMQFDVIETLLYNEPSLALSHGDTIKQTLDVQNVNAFHADTLIADDWRILEPWWLGAMGRMPYQQRLTYACFEENKRIADLPAKQFFEKKGHDMCPEQYPEDYNILKAFVQPGDPVTNIIQNIIMGGIVKGYGLIQNMHYQIADFKMATLGINIIQKDIRSEDTQDYLNASPENLQNPLTQLPFLWDEREGKIYYEDPDSTAKKSHRAFHLKTNLKK
jgi:hypothetical protein